MSTVVVRDLAAIRAACEAFMRVDGDGFENSESAYGPAVLALRDAVRPVPLFQQVEFTSHAGLPLHWKIECDALDEADWAGLAQIAAERLPAFRAVHGIERGGVPFARALQAHRSPVPELSDTVTPIVLLIADDVLTTGKSMRDALIDPEVTDGADLVFGVVAFARCEPYKVPDWVTPVFQLGPNRHSRLGAAGRSS